MQKAVRENKGFTLIEVLVAISVLLLLMVLMVQITSATSRSWQHTRGQIEAFQESRTAYETMTRKIRQATLNTYYDYDNFNSPTKYQRASELHFLCSPTSNGFVSSLFSSLSAPTHSIFFQAPIGFSNGDSYRSMETLLNSCGYYVAFSNDDDYRPAFIPSIFRRWRYRLKEWQAPAENLTIYTKTSGATSYDSASWIDLSTNSRVLAENVIALVVLPKLASDEDPTGATLSPDYFYDSRTLKTSDLSRNQLPPLVQVVMVAIDEKSALRLAEKYGTQPPPLVPSTLFRSSSDLTSDLDRLEKILTAAPGNEANNTIPLNYVIFNSQISIRGAKWSSL